MNQEEFLLLSKGECDKLNGLGHNEDCAESWRGGYIYLQEKIRELYPNEAAGMGDFLTAIEEIACPELDFFDDSEL